MEVIAAAVVPRVVARVMVAPATVVDAGVGLAVGVVAFVVEATVVAPVTVVVADGVTTVGLGLTGVGFPACVVARVVVAAETAEVLGFGELTVGVVETATVVVRWVIVECVEINEFPCARETNNKCR